MLFNKKIGKVRSEIIWEKSPILFFGFETDVEKGLNKKNLLHILQSKRQFAESN